MNCDGIYVASVAARLPEMLSAERAVDLGLYDRAAREHSGIESVSVAGHTSAPELAVQAGRAALEASGHAPDAFGALLHAATFHQGPDGWSAPHYVLRHTLDRPITAIEIRQGCAGMLAGLEMAAHRLIADPGGEAVLLTAADNFSVPLVDRWRASKLFVLADGAAAAVVSRRQGFARLVAFASISNPTMEEFHRGGEEIFPPGITEGRSLDFEKRTAYWRDLWTRGVPPPKGNLGDLVAETVDRALEHAGLDLAKISRFCHTAYGCEALHSIVLEPLGLAEEDGTFDIARRVGHAGAADPFIALERLWTTGELAPGDYVALLGAGPGMQVSCAVVEILGSSPVEKGAVAVLDGCTPWPADTAERYRRAGWWRGETLDGLVREWGRRFHSRPALVDRAGCLTFEELDVEVDRLAGAFVAFGLQPGDRVIVQLPNVNEFVTTVLGLSRAGAIPVFSLISHRAVEIRHLCRISRAVALVTPDSYRGFDHQALGAALLDEDLDLRVVFVASTGQEAATGRDPRIVALSCVAGEARPFPPGDPSDVAFFLLSGGTTALPKLIPRTHDDYAYQLRETVALCGIDRHDVYLAALPLEFNFTWGCPGVLGTLSVGGRVVIVDDPSPDSCFEVIREHGVTFTSLVPTMVRLWIEEAEWAEPPSGLGVLQVGGSRLDPSVAACVGPTLGCRLQQVYGMAEGLLCMSRREDDPDRLVETQGRPLSPGDEVRIVDDSGEAVPLGVTGEVTVRGPYTLRGYYNSPDHNRRAFTADGYYRTGDLARWTAAGDIVVEGRSKDIVIRGGNKVAAAEVEAHLAQLDCVAAAAVVPVPDEMLGERVCACVIAAGSVPSLPHLRAELGRHGLAEWKLPERLVVVDDFPLTPLGKVDKRALAARAAGSTPTQPQHERTV